MKQIKFQEDILLATALAVTDTAPVKNLLQLERALYFTTNEGLFVRLSYEGVNGWRLQANKKGYDAFDVIGAAQSLSVYLNEEVKDLSEPLIIQANEEKLVLTAQSGEQAHLSLAGDFRLEFFTPSHKCTLALSALFPSDQEICLHGRLDEVEAVYGGGERLDTVNKRGTQMDLYTCDGWNRSDTSYTVIPLFITTRGGGMFFNRYEFATIDFGKQSVNEWKYDVRSDILDAYFYATGVYTDAILGYSNLSGYADMPAPWMQGVQICRQWPDMTAFDADSIYNRLEDTPEYLRLYVKIENDFVPYRDLTEAQKAEQTLFYVQDPNAVRRYTVKDGVKYQWRYVLNDEGKYCLAGNHCNPLGQSVKTLMEHFIQNDMKPDAASMEPRGWELCFVDSDEGRKNKADLIRSVNWLHEHGLRAMVYIMTGYVVSKSIGFKDEYLVHADVTIANADGTTTEIQNTPRIPWVLGRSENPDVLRNPDGSMNTLIYLDITNDEALDWYFNQIWGEMIDIGIDGVKIDFCEMLPDHGVQYGNVTTKFHWKNPEKFMYATEHHAYPTYFISAFYRYMTERKAKRGQTDGFMLFSRGGGIGSQRSPYMWAGDQCRAFEKLDDQLMAVVNSGFSGIPFMSYDMGGYQYLRGFHYHNFDVNKDSEIFTRGIEFTAFTTNMQSHGDVRQVYEMSEEAKRIYRIYTRLHAELIPYMQKLSRIACKTAIPPVRHPVLHNTTDTRLYDLNDLFMLGDALLIAPILTEQTFQREVYLPQGLWKNLLTDETIEGGKTVTVQANLAQIPVFLNVNSSDATELEPIFGGINWTCIKNWK